jgi:hypothetical protein
MHYVVRNGRKIEVETAPTRGTVKKRRADGHIGCPVAWLKRVLPLVKANEHVAIAIWLHRRRAICKSNWFSVPNDALLRELGIGRRAKYKALGRLEAAGAIAIKREGGKRLQVQMLW